MTPTAQLTRGFVSRFLLIAVSLLLWIVCARLAWAQGIDPGAAQEASPKLEVIPMVGHAFSPPLREAIGASPSVPSVVTPRAVPLGRIPPLPGPVFYGRDSVVQEVAAPLVATTNLLNFEGIDSNGLHIPPDPNASVGATQIVEVVNSQYEVFDKATTALLQGPTNTNMLFASFAGGPADLCATTNNGDAVVLYDKLAGRWLISQFAFDSTNSTNLQCVAISTSSDATGSYNIYSFSFGNVLNDYGKFGVWPDAYYFSANMFNEVPSETFAGAEVCAFERAAMLAGNTARMMCSAPLSSEFTLLPSDLDGLTLPPSGEPNFFVGVHSTNSLTLGKFHVDWVTPNNSTFNTITIPVAGFTFPCGSSGVCIPQLGTTQQLDSLGGRAMFRLAYRNFGDHESLVVNHTVEVDPTTHQTGVRWYEIRNPNGTTPTIFQQSTFAPDSNSRWMASVAMDNAGDIAMGYSVSSSAINPEIHYTGRVPADPVSAMETEATIIDGTGSQPPISCVAGPCGERWGDYTSMSIDPADDCTFWYTNEYLTTTTTSINWHTRIASFRFPSCAATSTFTLTVTLEGTGSGTVTSADNQINCGTSCSTNYNAGTQVTLNAAAAAGSTFGGWSGACTGLGSCSVTMSSNVAVTATFNPAGSPTVTTTAATMISSSGGTINGLANANNTATNVWFEWGTSSTLASFNQCSSVSISGTATYYVWCPLTGLSSGTTYYYRIAAFNSAGTVRGAILNFTAQAQDTSGALRFIPLATPCRIADTRNAPGPFGGPTISAKSSRDFVIPNSACGIPYAAAYSLNVTAVPATNFLGYLTIWPMGGPPPLVSTLNAYDGRIKANAAIVPAGTNGAVSVYVTDPTDVVLDINGYFVPGPDPSALAFYPLTPCRIADTRNPNGPLGGPSLTHWQERSFPVLSSSCNVPSTAKTYSLNFTVVPRGFLGFLTTWPTGMPWPLVSTLNAPTGTVTANAAIVPAGANGAVSALATDDADLVIDINGYFAPSTSNTGLSLYTLAPCRVDDTRNTTGSFKGTLPVDVKDSSCGVLPSTQAFVLNASVIPNQSLGFLILWPDGASQPFVSTLNALDGMITSNMAIVPTVNGSIDVFSLGTTQLVLDISAYFAP